MKKRPSAAVRRVALVALCASSLAAACSFPDVTFEDGGVGDGTTGSDASQDSTTSEGSVAFDTGGGDEGVTGTDAPVGDGPRAADVGVEAGAETGVDAGVDAAPVDSGPDVSSVPDAADTGVPKDSGGVTDGPNCDCAVSQMYATGITCTGVLGICAGKQGFMTTPSCGESADFFTCASGLGSCTQDDLGSRVQQCQ
jgi:hypothetical protein